MGRRGFHPGLVGCDAKVEEENRRFFYIHHHLREATTYMEWMPHTTLKCAQIPVNLTRAQTLQV